MDTFYSDRIPLTVWSEVKGQMISFMNKDCREKNEHTRDTNAETKVVWSFIFECIIVQWRSFAIQSSDLEPFSTSGTEVTED